MGYRNSIDPEKMEIEISSFIASPLADHTFPKLVSSRVIWICLTILLN